MPQTTLIDEVRQLRTALEQILLVEDRSGGVTLTNEKLREAQAIARSAIEETKSIINAQKPAGAVQSAEAFAEFLDNEARKGDGVLNVIRVSGLIRERDAAIRRIVVEEHAAERRVLLEVEKAAREFMPFFQPGYQGVPLANLRHALEAYETFKYSLIGL